MVINTIWPETDVYTKRYINIHKFIFQVLVKVLTQKSITIDVITGIIKILTFVSLDVTLCYIYVIYWYTNQILCESLIAKTKEHNCDYAVT